MTTGGAYFAIACIVLTLGVVGYKAYTQGLEKAPIVQKVK
jgi:hypothetical protein